MSAEPYAIVLVPAAIASAVLHVRAERRGPRRLVYTFKPLTTTLLILMAMLLPTFREDYRYTIAAGLAASLAGDVFLMLPRDRFIAGLASFLLAHVAYTVAFSRVAPLAEAPLPVAVYAAIGVILLAILWPRLGSLRVPVVVYAAALMLMAAQAVAHAGAVASVPARFAAIGAALFVASDSLLAVNRFSARIPNEQVWIMGTYVPAQVLIALSVLP